MTWKDILKIEPYERATAEEFAEEDMGDWRDEKHRKNEEAGIERYKTGFIHIREWMEDNKDSPDENTQDAIRAFGALMEHAATKPTLRTYESVWNSILAHGREFEDWPIKRGKE
jgi:hypothetical protein